MNLKDLAKASAAIQPNHSVLLYGPPKTGKTKLVGTAARIKEINNIYWFDIENGIETLLHMGLTDEELAKVTVFKIPDTRDNPIAIETLLKAFSSKTPINICDLHGRVSCVECAKNKLPAVSFCINKCTHNDLVVIDSGSQAGDSAMAALCLGKDSMFKPGWDEYGIQSKWLGDICSIIQQATYTNFVVITHEICIENDEKKDMFYPLMGTKAFCMKVGKYFGTVVYVHKKLNKHVAGSSSTYLGDRVTGSRVNAAIEKSAGEADMRTILIEGGILRPGSTGAVANTSVSSVSRDISGLPVSDKNILSIRKDLDIAKEVRVEMKQELAATPGGIDANIPVPVKKNSFAERMAAKKTG